MYARLFYQRTALSAIKKNIHGVHIRSFVHPLKVFWVTFSNPVENLNYEYLFPSFRLLHYYVNSQSQMLLVENKNFLISVSAYLFGKTAPWLMLRIWFHSIEHQIANASSTKKSKLDLLGLPCKYL